MHHIRHFGFMAPRVRTERLQQIRPLLGLKRAEPSVSESDERNDSEEERERQDADQPTPRRCRYCGVGRFVLIAQTPRPTVAQLMQMPPSMEPPAESRHVRWHLPLSVFTLAKDVQVNGKRPMGHGTMRPAAFDR